MLESRHFGPAVPCLQPHPASRRDLAWTTVNTVADLPDDRDRWIRWDQELTSTCPECSRTWADHPGGIQLWAQDGHLGRVLPPCEAPDTRPDAAE